MPSLVLLGHDAPTDASFPVEDLPGAAGRLDVLCRALTSALLTSHGIRGDWQVDLVLLGPPDPPRRVTVDGGTVRNLNPDERTTALLLKKVLAEPTPGKTPVEVRPGIRASGQGLADVLDERGPPLFVLEEDGHDVRDVDLPVGATFVAGDHRDLTDEERSLLDDRDARPLSVGPTSLQVHQVVAVLQNELDRRDKA